jgi:hypothetical protein
MKQNILKLAGVLFSVFLMISCSEDDATGYSNMRATSPSLSVSTDFNSSETLVENDATYTFTVSISEPQIVDVQVKLAQVGGDATEGLDFEFPHSVTIKAGSTSATGEIKILSDDLAEETETVELQIGLGNESNVSSVSSTTVSFTIQNSTKGDLEVNLSWEASEATTDNSGASIDATDLADLRLLLTDASNPYTTIIDGADGAGFEHLTISDDIADGEYYLVADFFAAMDIVRDLNLTLTFDQVGIINHQTINFSNALNTGITCEAAFYVMAKLTKSGDSYTIENIGESSPAPSIAEGMYDVVSNGETTDSGPTENPLVDFNSTVSITDNGDGTFTFSDGWAGVYIEWYDIYGISDEQPIVVSLDGCGNLSAEWTGPFGGGQTLTGTLNADGSFNIRIDNTWGDYIESVYTPQ